MTLLNQKISEISDKNILLQKELEKMGKIERTNKQLGKNNILFKKLSAYNIRKIDQNIRDKS